MKQETNYDDLQEYKASGTIRTLVFWLGFIGGAIGWGVFLLILARFLPMLRLLGRYLWLDMAIIGVLGILTAFWVVNYRFIVPLSTIVNNTGFLVMAPGQPATGISITWAEIQRIRNLQFGTYVTVRATNGRFYRFIFGRDIYNYARLIRALHSNYEENRYRKWRGK